jgi:hypothetical protein
MDMSNSPLSSPATRFARITPHSLHRCTMRHSPLRTTHMLMGSISPRQPDRRSPIWRSTCRLQRQRGQWFLCSVPSAAPGTTSPQCSHLKAGSGSNTPACGLSGRVMLCSFEYVIADNNAVDRQRESHGWVSHAGFVSGIAPLALPRGRRVRGRQTSRSRKERLRSDQQSGPSTSLRASRNPTGVRQRNELYVSRNHHTPPSGYATANHPEHLSNLWQWPHPSLGRPIGSPLRTPKSKHTIVIIVKRDFERKKRP